MYTPNNQFVYLQAFAGAVAGLLGQSTPLTSGTRGYYTATMDIAGAWAQEVDTLWDSPTNPDQFEFAEIFAFSNDLFLVTEPQPSTGNATPGSGTNPATYANSVNALMSLMTDAETYLTGQGITPGPIPGGSGGNYVAIDRGAPANYATPAASIIAAIVVTPRASGIFRVTAGLGLTDSSSEEVSMFLYAQEQAVAGTPITLTGGTAAAQLGSGTGANALGETMTAVSTAIGITGGTGAKELATKNITAVATDPTNVGISGIFSYSTGGTTKTPFALNETCVLYVAVTCAAGTLSAMNLDFSVEELAAA